MSPEFWASENWAHPVREQCGPQKETFKQNPQVTDVWMSGFCTGSALFKKMLLLDHTSDKCWVFIEVTVRINFRVAVILKKTCRPTLCTSSLKISTFLIMFFDLCSNLLKFVKIIIFVKRGSPIFYQRAGFSHSCHSCWFVCRLCNSL